MKASVLFSVVMVVAAALSAAPAEGQAVKPPESHPRVSDTQGRWRPVPCDPEKHPGKCGKNIWLPFDQAMYIAEDGMFTATKSHFVVEKETFWRILLFRPPARRVLVSVRSVP